jgi:hypothetical protein
MPNDASAPDELPYASGAATLFWFVAFGLCAIGMVWSSDFRDSDSASDAEIWDAATNSWQHIDAIEALPNCVDPPMPALPAPPADGAQDGYLGWQLAPLHDGRTLATRVDDAVATESCEVRLYGDGWQSLGHVPSAFPRFAAGLADGGVLFVGERGMWTWAPGRDWSALDLPDGGAPEEYSTFFAAGHPVLMMSTGGWTFDGAEWAPIAPIPTPHAGATPCFVGEDRIVVAGGVRSEDQVIVPVRLAAELAWCVGALVLVVVAVVSRTRRRYRTGALVAGLLTFASITVVGYFLYFLMHMGFAHGRPVRIAGVRMRAGRARVRGDARRAIGLARMLAGAAWARDAALEHASIEAFVRLAADLRAVGAPDALVEGAEGAAREEIRHTGLCLETARRILGLDIELVPPAPAAYTRSPDRRALVVQLAVESLEDGCLGEGFAALEASAAASLAADDRTRAALEQIARDEAGHAELARRVLRWCRACEPEAVDRALTARVQELSRRRRPRALASGGWLGRALGPLGRPTEAAPGVRYGRLLARTIREQRRTPALAGAARVSSGGGNER